MIDKNFPKYQDFSPADNAYRQKGPQQPLPLTDIRNFCGPCKRWSNYSEFLKTEFIEIDPNVGLLVSDKVVSLVFAKRKKVQRK